VIDKNEEKTKNKQLIHNEFFTMCNMFFEDLDGERINLKKVIYTGLEFYEIYECYSEEKENIYINRLNPYFITTEIIGWKDGNSFKPYYKKNNVGEVNIFFSIKPKEKTVIQIKNTVAKITYIKY
jgi:hypothetical protein